jgi:hypothetical protein
MPFKTFRSFGGVYDGDPDLALPDDAARLAVNVRFISQGIRRQYGFNRIVDTKAQDSSANDQFITALWDYMDGSDKHVLAVAGDQLLELNDWTARPTTWDVIHTGLAIYSDVPGGSGNSGLRTSFVTAFGRCYIQNGYMDPIVYDGPSGEVYEWGIDGPGSNAPTAIALNEIGTAGGTFGEFDVDNGDFEKQKGFWTDTTASTGDKDSYTEGRIGNRAKDWVNKGQTRCDSSSLTPFGYGTSIKVSTGVTLGKEGRPHAVDGDGPITYRSMTVFSGLNYARFNHDGSGSGSYANWKWMRDSSIWGNHIWENGVYHNEGSVDIVAGSTNCTGNFAYFTSDMVGMLIEIDGNAYQIAAYVGPQQITLDRNAVTTATDVPYIINNSFFRYKSNHILIKGRISGNLFRLYFSGGGGWGGSTESSQNWEIYQGPNDGELYREIPIAIDGTNTTISASAYVRAAHEDVELEIRGNGNGTSRSQTIVSLGVGEGDLNWHRLNINGHTFLAGETSGRVYLRTKYDRTASLDQKKANLAIDGVTSRDAWFDEVRLNEGSTSPSEGGALNGTYQYRYSFFDEGDGTVSNWSDASNSIDVKNGLAQVTLPIGPNGLTSALGTGKWYDPSSGEHAVTHVRVCRAQSTDEGQTFGPYYVVKEETLSAIETAGGFPWTFDDDVSPTVAETNEICEGEIIDPPRGKFIVMYEGMMVVAGIYNSNDSDSVPSDGRRLYYSDVNTPGVFRASGYLEIDTNDNDQITGLAVNQGRLWVFTKDSVYEVSALGDDFERVTKRHDGIGCVSGFGISSFEGVLFFPDRNGVYAMDANGSLKRITEHIELAWKRGIDFDALQLAVLTDKKLWFNSLSFLWCFDLEQKDSLGNGKWSTLYSGQNFWTIGYVDSGPDNKLIMADEEGYLYEMDDSFTRFGRNDGTLGAAVTAASANTIECAGGLYTNGDGLENVYVTNQRYNADGEYIGAETKRILSNTATAITIDGTWTDVPVPGQDYLELGRNNTIYRTKWHDFGEPSVKKLVKRMKLGLQASFSSITGASNLGDWTTVTWVSRERDNLGEIYTQGYYGLNTDSTDETKWLNVRSRGYMHSFGFASWGDADVTDCVVYMMVEFEGKGPGI